MSEAIWSAEYAREMVERARDGATFWHSAAFAAWVPDSAGVSADVYDGRNHWREWYRETCAAAALLHEITRLPRYEPPQISDNDLREEIKEARDTIFNLLDRFVDNAKTIGTLCQLPAEWTVAMRAEAARIGGV